MKSRKWLTSMSTAHPRGRVQAGRWGRIRNVPDLPEGILRLAYAQYHHLYGDQQSFEHIQERGGFSVDEVIGLLADYVERLHPESRGSVS